MLCFNFGLGRAEERRQPHEEDSSPAKPHIPPLEEEKDGDDFVWQLIRRFFLLMETWRGS